jgi:hypothetical protein
MLFISKVAQMPHNVKTHYEVMTVMSCSIITDITHRYCETACRYTSDGIKVGVTLGIGTSERDSGVTL